LGNEEEIYRSNSVGVVERLESPVYVAKWILCESSDVLERSPFLSVISRLLGLVYPFSNVSIYISQESSKGKRLEGA
jgi:hypothetical protein